MMELPEWTTRKTLAVIILVAVIVVAALLVVMLQDQLKPKSVPKLETVVAAEPETAVAAEPETVAEGEVTIIPRLEIIPENVTSTETAAETVPKTDLIPEPLAIEIIEDPVSPADMPEIPATIPTPPAEIPSIPAKVMQDKVDRFNADSGTPVPEKGAAAGTVNKIHSGNVLELNGILVKLRGVDTPDGDDGEPDFDQWRQALMRICPVGSLALYDHPNRTPDSQGRISTNVWCYGYPHAAPLASANDVMSEADYDIIGRGCQASHETRLLGCTR